MNRRIPQLALGALSIVATSVVPFCCAENAQQPSEPAGQAAVAHRIGIIQSINGDSITLKPESGPVVSVSAQPNARLLRIPPGEKDLKNATPFGLQELQVGDTIRVRGLASGDGNSIAALEILLITRSTVDAVRDQIRQDWQKRGIGGLVRAVDASTGTVTISVTGFGTVKNIVLKTGKDTVIRRYAPDSVKFDDAKTSSLAEIHPGDQLRARGGRNADGTELKAEEIVTGNFPYVEGTISSIDSRNSTISVQDLLTRKSVVVKITADSQLRQLSPEIAQRIAMRLKGAAGGGSTDRAGGGPPVHTENGGMPPGGNSASGGRRGGAPDLQQMLNRLPPATLGDLHKGDAVLIIATQGTESQASSAINLYSGVDAILRAAPGGSEAMVLGAWSLGAPSGDGGNQ